MEKKENKIPSRPHNPPNLCDDCGGYRVHYMQGKDKCECLLPHGIAWKYLDNISSSSPLKEHETKQRLALAEDIMAIITQTKKYASKPTPIQAESDELSEKLTDQVKKDIRMMIDFTQWYSGMDRAKVESAWCRYLKEVLESHPPDKEEEKEKKDPDAHVKELGRKTGEEYRNRGLLPFGMEG